MSGYEPDDASSSLAIPTNFKYEHYDKNENTTRNQISKNVDYTKRSEAIKS